MMNIMVIKKYAAFLLCTLIPLVTYVTVTTFYGMIWGIISLIIATVLSLICGIILIDHPFRAVVEGQGLLCLDLNSTGMIIPFIMNIDNPYIRGILKKKAVGDVYDREAVYQMTEPVDGAKLGTSAEVKDDNIIITLNESQYHKARFALGSYVTLIYNSQIQSLITKDMLSENEKIAFAEHQILYTNRKLEELTTVMRDFARYVVELLKPKVELNIFTSWWFWVIIGIVGIIILGMFAPQIIAVIKGTAAGVVP